MEFSAIGDVIFFAVLAGFIWYKLRMTLGRKDDAMPPSQMTSSTASDERASKPVVKLPPVRLAGEKPQRSLAPATRQVKEPEITDPALAETLKKFQQRDKSFTPGWFLEGAGAAFEMVLNAYSKGDLKTLAGLLDGPIFQSFKEDVERRKTTGEVLEQTLVSIDASEILSASLEKNIAQVRVRFITQQISLIKDKEGKILEGNPSRIERITDEWTFSRDIGSANPNWTITEI
jgi:predicted lipid-binding transport protein (Tim44 family)